VLHVSGHDTPLRSVPSVHMTTVGTSPIAVPNLVGTSQTPIEGSEAALAQTRLTLHRPRLRPSQVGPRARVLDARILTHFAAVKLS